MSPVLIAAANCRILASLSSSFISIPPLCASGMVNEARGASQRAVRPVLIVVGLVLAQDLVQAGLVPDEGAVQELASASADPAFDDRVRPTRS